MNLDVNFILTLLFGVLGALGYALNLLLRILHSISRIEKNYVEHCVCEKRRETCVFGHDLKKLIESKTRRF